MPNAYEIETQTPQYTCVHGVRYEEMRTFLHRIRQQAGERRLSAAAQHTQQPCLVVFETPRECGSSLLSIFFSELFYIVKTASSTWGAAAACMLRGCCMRA